MKVINISLLLSAMLGGHAFSSEMFNASKFWVGAGAGAAQLDVSSKASDFRTRAFSGKLDAGFDITDYLGLYTSYDFMQYVPEAQDIHLGSVGFRGVYDLTEQLDIIGKVGMTYPFDERSSSSFSPSAGLGLEYKLTNAVSTRVGVDFYHDLSLREEKSGDLYQAYWGLTYRFGQPDTPLVIQKEVPVEVVKVKEVEVIKEVVSQQIIKEKLFATGSYELVDASSLDDMVDALRQNQALTVSVVGYADSTGNRALNQRLSEQRVTSVVNYFVGKGIDASRIASAGKGIENPVASNETPVGRAQNRRVVITVQ